MATKQKHPIPLWRVTARHAKVGRVDLLVAARTAADARAIVEQGATVVRCTREVRS